ncbi:MAG: M23 family metallopeptidase [Candidatus Sumerlaeota bacterium]|nr:M23 family metallopeptidase [Candidatus Sumerlaeota bacterium]
MRMRLPLLCALAIAAATALAQDDQKLVQDDNEKPALTRPDENERKAKQEALETVKQRLDQMEREAQSLGQTAEERQRVLDAAKTSLAAQAEAAKLAERTVEANLQRIETLKVLKEAFQKERDDAAGALQRRLTLLYLAEASLNEGPLDAAGAIHEAVWRAAAHESAFRFAHAEEAARRAAADLQTVQTVVRRQQSLGDRSAGEAQAIRQNVTEAEQGLADLAQQRQAQQNDIGLLRSRQKTLQDLVSYLADQERLYNLKETGRGGAPEAGGDQRLVAPEPGEAERLGTTTRDAADSLTRPLEEPAAPAAPAQAGPGQVPGVEIDTGESTAVHAVVGGEVLYAGPLPYYDQIVILNHHDGYFTVYAYLKRIFVTKGEALARGDVLGMSGPFSSGPRRNGVRFEVRKGETSIDPSQWGRTPADLPKALLEGVFGDEAAGN